MWTSPDSGRTGLKFEMTSKGFCTQNKEIIECPSKKNKKETLR